jgi:hypothetical protein
MFYYFVQFGRAHDGVLRIFFPYVLFHTLWIKPLKLQRSLLSGGMAGWGTVAFLFLPIVQCTCSVLYVEWTPTKNWYITTGIYRSLTKSL